MFLQIFFREFQLEIINQTMVKETFFFFFVDSIRYNCIFIIAKTTLVTIIDQDLLGRLLLSIDFVEDFQ